MWFENQFPYFLWMIICGAGIMLCYDFLRIFRRIIKHSHFFVNMEDVLYACVCAVIVYYITYLKNSGEVRFQTIFGLLVGCVLYAVTVKENVVIAGTKIIGRIGKTVKKLLKSLFYPLFIIVKIVLKPARFMMWYTGKGIRSVKHKTELKFKNMKQILKRK